jgi:6-phosphofructokinase 1
MITFFEGYLKPIPFVEMIDYSTGKVKIRTVDITSETYEVGRKYMIRLEKEDFEAGRIESLAKTANMSPEEFKARFGYVVEPGR